ncbi:MAG: N-acetylmannosamine-6-phosphate 2-epimerase [Erysipelotrichaceae bacterium]|nr:N-acetylmannosamine-6-phosphate 2-epimerase [Erysipelotrichaceae bacterium]
MKSKEQVLNQIRNQVLVSCQAYEPNPHATINDMVKMALAGQLAGCKGFRANHPDYVRAIRKAVGEEPVIIGIWKIHTPGNDVYITPTMQAVRELVDAGSDIIALDCTNRVNAYGKYCYDLIPQIKEEYPDIVIMADCSTYEEAKHAAELGADIVASTLSGYTEYTLDRYPLGTDFQLLKDMATIPNVFVLAEGRIWTREEAVTAFESGASACVIGTAITSPWMITDRFVKAVNKHFNR